MARPPNGKVDKAICQHKSRRSSRSYGTLQSRGQNNVLDYRQGFTSISGHAGEQVMFPFYFIEFW